MTSSSEPERVGREVTGVRTGSCASREKRKFAGDVVAYLVINAFLVGVWAVTGFGYFWPGWVLAAWGVFLLLDAWNLYYRKPITENDIERELRGSGGRPTFRASGERICPSAGISPSTGGPFGYPRRPRKR